MDVSPDSLHPESFVAGPEQAVERARRLLAVGADGMHHDAMWEVAAADFG